MPAMRTAEDTALIEVCRALSNVVNSPVASVASLCCDNRNRVKVIQFVSIACAILASIVYYYTFYSDSITIALINQNEC